MKKPATFKFFSIFAVVLALVFSVGVFAAPGEAYADNNTYTITFKCSGADNSNAAVIKSVVVDEGDSLLLSDMPKEGDEGLPRIENNKYIWFYVVDGKLIRATIPAEETGVVLENITSDIVFWAIKQDISKKHEVTFIMPDSTVVTKFVSDGETVDEPIYDLGFCERIKYDKSLENIREDMTINVTIDNTFKYVFMAGCFALLVTSLVVIVVIVFKSFKDTDEDDEYDDLEDELVSDGDGATDNE